MKNFQLTHQLSVLVICALGLILAIVVGWKIGEANYTLLVLSSVIAIIALITFFSGRFFWVLTIASSFLLGTFPILRGSFTPFQIFMTIGVTKFLIEDVVLRRTVIKKPGRLDLLMIFGFMAIITLHGVQDRFGMKFLGSSVWGGKNYVNVYVGLAAFFVVQSIPTTTKQWAKLPYLVLAVTGFDLAIAVITTIFPASIYRIYPFYSAVSQPGIAELFLGESDRTGRVGDFGNFGFILVTLILARSSLREILSPSNFFRLLGIVTGGLAALYSGFRSKVINTLLVVLVAGMRDLKFAVILVLPILAALLFGLSVINSDFVPLPKQIQRGLAFVPGGWDTEMKLDAAESNEFRRRVWTLWAKDFFPVHPFIGRGFGFSAEWGRPSVYKYDPNDDLKTVASGNVHNGFFAALDALGIVGTFCFLVWNLRLLVRAFRVPFRRNDPHGMTLRFLALYLAVSIITYWFGAETVGMFLPREFALAGVFLRLLQLDAASVGRASAAKQQQHPEEQLATAMKR